jgi:N6-adenosine-specific RNA methylase IME4
MLPDAIDVMNSWGFKYKTTITWRKIMSKGMGYWWRGQCEFLLFGTKGNVKAFRMQ